MRLFILRHGQTDLNLARKVQGHMDVDLNATGIEQAEDLAKVVREKNLRFDAIYCSPLRRALDTCEIAPDEFQPAGRGETFQHLIQRITDFLEELKTREQGNVLVASHGTAIHAMLLYFRHKELKNFWDEDVHNCDLMIVDCIDGEYVVRDEKIAVEKKETGYL